MAIWAEQYAPYARILSKCQYIDLDLKLLSQNVTQKTNEWISFSMLMTPKYLKLEFWFLLLSITEYVTIENKFVCFGRRYGSTTAQRFCFEIYWPLEQ